MSRARRLALSITIRAICFLLVAIVTGTLTAVPVSAERPGANPLSVPDTSSPRATLQGFLAVTDDIYTRWAKLLSDYGATRHLYPTPEERAEQKDILRTARTALRALDLSGISPVLRDTVSAERFLQLREILDRIDIPPFADIPDDAAMAGRLRKRWRLPNTEIDFVLIDQGPRAGEYLVSAETVDRLPEFYRRVENLPYKPGPGKLLNETFQSLSPARSKSNLDYFLSSPVGLSYVIPLSWMLRWPDWMRTPIGGEATWQWLGLAIAAVTAAGIVLTCHRLAKRARRRQDDESRPGWHSLLLPLGVIFVTAVLLPAAATVLRIGGLPRVVIAYSETAAFYLAAAWLVMAATGRFGDLIVGAEHLSIRSLDSQLIRLGTRFAGISIAIGLLISGADDLGFPAYSVIAGLGVGGLAVALAARDSIANLIGSMLIMFEKPFRVGHYIRLSGTEGTVEDVGFRSTRIRTLDTSVVSIPNNSIVNATVENRTLRPKRRERFFVGVRYDTPRHKLEEFIETIKTIIVEHESTDKDDFQVYLYNLAESSLEVMVIFNLFVADYSAELRARQEILMAIIGAAEDLEIAFAFPTRTLHVEGGPTQPPSLKASALLRSSS